jgi:hypothetical protein
MAKRPYLTTSESSKDRDQIVQLFKSRAERSLAHAIDQLNARSLYARALDKIEQGQDLSDELPELKSVSKSNAIRVIKNLIKDEDAQVDAGWALDPRYADLFKTSIRVKHLEGELFPSFDVEYTAVTEEGDVVTSITTYRRIVTVTIAGTDTAYRYLTRRLIMAGLE